MKTTNLWNDYVFYTRDVTEHGRKLAFATAAICWFFKTPQVTFPTHILWSLAFVVCFFFLDILQYFSAGLLVGYWTRRQEKKMWKENGTIDGDIEKPAWLDKPAFVMFIFKMVFLMASFFCLACEFYLRLKFGL